MIEGVLVTLVAIAQRLLTVRALVPTFDAYGHLYFAKLVREQQAGPFGSIKLNVVCPRNYRQPFLWHWLIGMLPGVLTEKGQKWINPVLDGLYAGAIYILILVAGYSQSVAFGASGAYIVSPMFFSSISTGPRINALTPRAASEVAGSLFFALTVLPLNWPIWIILGCAIVLGAFVILSSKFGIQALLFLSPVISVLVGDPMPVIAVAMAFALSFMLAGRGFIESISAQFSHLRWYFREALNGHMPISNRNSIRQFVNVIRDNEGMGRLRELAYSLLRMNSYTAVALKLPVLVGLIAVYVVSPFSLAAQDGSFLLAPVGAGVLVYVLINWRPLLFLGEAERYLNYVSLFVVAGAAYCFVETNTEWVFLVILAFGIMYWVAEVLLSRRIISANMIRNHHALDEVVHDLRNKSKSKTVAVYPYIAGGGVFRIAFSTGARVLYPFCTVGEFFEKFERRYSAGYPYIRLDRVDELAEEYGVDYLIIYRSALEKKGLSNWVPSHEWRHLNLGSPVFDVFERQSDKKNP